MDAQSLKKLVRLEEIIAETEPLVERGRYWHGQNHDSLVVKPEEQLYFWNSRRGNRPGDVYTWLMESNGWSFAEALADVARRAGVELKPAQERPARSSPPRALSPQTARRLAPPPVAWQQRGRELVARTQATLWSDEGRPALEMLYHRGLAEAIIKRAGLGWNPADVWDEPGAWGFTGGNKVWVPRGVVIPWEIQDQLWRLRLRRPDGDLGQSDSRYISPRLYPPGKRQAIDHEALYNAGALTPGRPAILLEGELDCLTMLQAAGDLAVSVATGSVSGARRSRWIARLARASSVLVAFDADPAGDANARYWLQVLPNARRWRPFWEDANQMAQDGVDLRAWLKAGLPDPAEDRWPITILWPATHPEVAMPPTWRRLPDERLKAVYYSIGELQESIKALASVQTALELGGVCSGPA
jgi:hypothetical protein